MTDRVFQCFPPSPQTATYHTQLHMTQDTSVMELITDIQEWIFTGVSIPVQFLSLGVEEFCAISSNTPLEQCPVDTTTTMSPVTVTMPPVTVTMPPVTVSPGSFTLTISVAVVAVFIVLLMVAVVIVLVVLLKRRHRSSLDIAEDSQ